jgi:hypothetical protein
VSGNSATFEGGGIAARGGSTTLRNATVSGNHTEHFGVGLFAAAPVEIWNSTFANNTTDQLGSAIYGDVREAAGNVFLGTASSAVFYRTCDGGLYPVSSSGYNIESPEDTCGLNLTTDQTNLTTAALNLGPLQDNGGPTLTHDPTAPSVAIDQIPVVDCVEGNGTPITADQRGVSRPWGPNCDVGAVEVGDVLLSIDLSSTTLVIDGPVVSYTATINNAVEPLSGVSLQGWIEQGAASRAASGTSVRCDGVPDGELPLGSCNFDYTTRAQNTGAGSGSLVPGAATARFELLLDEPGGGSVVLREIEIPVTLQ